MNISVNQLDNRRVISTSADRANVTIILPSDTVCNLHVGFSMTLCNMAENYNVYDLLPPVWIHVWADSVMLPLPKLWANNQTISSMWPANNDFAFATEYSLPNMVTYTLTKTGPSQWLIDTPVILSNPYDLDLELSKRPVWMPTPPTPRRPSVLDKLDSFWKTCVGVTTTK